MRAERERLNAKIVAENLRLGAEARELTSEEELCYLILVSGGSCNVQWDGQTTLAAPGCALLLGPGSGRLQQAGSVPPELLGCRFPVAALHDIRNMAQRDDSALFEPGQATLLYGPVQWSSCLRTVLELMRKARGEQDYPGVLYLGLLLHYAEQEYRAESHAAGCEACGEALADACTQIVGLLAAASAAGAVPGAASVSNDGYSVTFGSNASVTAAARLEAYEIIRTALGSDPHDLLYRGIL